MFERFTQEARAVVALAREQAGALGADRVGNEHLLLGVAGARSAAARVLEPLGLGHAELRAALEQTGGLDADALASIGIDLTEVRRRTEESFGPGALGGRPGKGFRPFTPEAKKSLELSLREAIVHGDREIGPEHILLGVLRDPGEPVAGLLRGRGQTPDSVRAAVLAARTRAA
jgi:ATP-dependent Clp protease ATP-binding subunit ClpA